MSPELIMADVMEPLDGRLLDRAVHAFNLAIGPGMFRLGQAMFNVILRASQIKGVASEKFLFLKHVSDFGYAPSLALGIGEMGTVIGQDSMDFIGNSLNGLAEKIGGNAARCFLMQLGKSNLAGAVNRNQQVKLSLCGMNFCNVDMKITDRVMFKLLAYRFVALDIWQPTDAVTLQAAMQGRAGQARDRRLQGVQTIVKRQQRMLAKGHNDGFFLNCQNC